MSGSGPGYATDVPGVFEIELHESKAELPSLEVR